MTEQEIAYWAAQDAKPLTVKQCARIDANIAKLATMDEMALRRLVVERPAKIRATVQ